MRAILIRLVIVVLAALLLAAVATRFVRRTPRTSAHPAHAESTQQSSKVPAGPTTTSVLPTNAIVSPPANASFAAAPALSPNSTPLPAAAKVNKAPTPVGPPDEAAMLEIDQVNLMIRDYRTLAGENPVGTNAEMMAAIMGDNPKQAKLGPPEGLELNDKGELLDRWGTPYFFHQLSRDHMEIRSAGPDKVMWTLDDPVIK